MRARLLSGACVGAAALFLLSGTAAFAFNPPVDTAGPLRVWIEGPETIALPQTPIPMTVWIENTAAETVSGTLRLEGIDDWRMHPAEAVPFTVPGGETILAPISATAGEGTYNALYPFHGYVEFEHGGKPLQAHPILILRTEFPEEELPNPEARVEPEYVRPTDAVAFRTEPGVLMEGAVGGKPLTVKLGEHGLLDGTVAFEHGAEAYGFQGFEIEVLGVDLHDADGPAVLTGVQTDTVNAKATVRHRFALGIDTFDVVIACEATNDALLIRLALENAPTPRPWRVARLENVSLGAWNKPIHRVYAGHGNVIERPRVFTPGYEGHRLSTSYVGADFEGGGSLVYGTFEIPDRLRVIPDRNVFTLDVPHGHTLIFIPTPNVWKGVKVWRSLDTRIAAGGVTNLAGRFAFDLWFGRSFTEGAEGLAKAFRYGLTDSVVVWHDWQRWGYDYRLPDILPPNPEHGGSGEFKQLIELCRDNGVLFAPHDNYIDFYPDATGFTYDRIAFEGNGKPDEAWFNKGRGAQSCLFRADQFRPFLERNLSRMRDEFAPTAYFIDVWSSRPPYDYWTRDGNFFDRYYTKKQWQEAFAYVRETLGNNAPTISESGKDQLIGYLDGAQTNHLRVDATPASNARYFVWRVHCEDAERIPWFDAAHHHRYALQGAGYSSRYSAGLDGRTHGIYSDDYMATEVLTGHPAMVSGTFGRNVVRKYWLLHGVGRSLALGHMEGFEFAGGDIHRQHVIWDQGGQVWVNRGTSDWEVEGHILPQYGFYASMPGGVEAAIERKDGVIVEWSRSPEVFYCNGREVNPESLPSDATEYAARVNPDAKPIDFGLVTTAGGVRLTHDGEALLFTPLPEGWKAFEAAIRWESLPWKLPLPTRIAALDEFGKTIATQEANLRSGAVTLNCEPDVFAYRLTAK